MHTALSLAYHAADALACLVVVGALALPLLGCAYALLDREG